MMINNYKKWSEPTVLKTIAISEWLDQIKESEFSNDIIRGRVNENLYDEIKATLPCVTYNFLFDNYKLNDNIISGTGFLYIDIDSPLFEPDELDLSKVYSYYHSYGGIGYAIIVQVVGLTLDNFNLTYIDVCKQLDILEYIDKNAVKASQFNVLSYDPEIFINANSHVFSSTNKSNITYNFNGYTSSNTTQNSPTIYENKKNRTYTDTLGEFFNSIKQVRYSNIHQSEVEGDYMCDWENGYTEIRCLIPYKKLKDKRKRTLIGYTGNLVYLNPFLTYDWTLSIILRVSKLMCEIPLDYKIVQGIVKSIFQQKEKGSLLPSTIQRKIIFSNNTGLTGKEKATLCLKLYHKHKIEQSKNKIYQTIEAWDFNKYGKITATKVSSESNLNIKTVEKYWKEFKSFVGELNRDHQEKFCLKVTVRNLNQNVTTSQVDKAHKASDDFHDKSLLLKTG